MTRVGDLGKKFTIKTINDFLKSSMCDASTQSRSRYSIYHVPVVVGSKLTCKGWYRSAYVIFDMIRPVNN